MSLVFKPPVAADQLRVCCWRETPQAGLPPLPVVKEVNVLGDVCHGFGARPVAPVMHEFSLERAPEALDPIRNAELLRSFES